MKDQYPEIETKRDMKECTFHPNINENSQKLYSQRDRNCFEHLYNQAKTNSKLKEEKLKEREDELNAKSLEGCTFKPDLELSHKAAADLQIPPQDERLEERALKWAQEKRKQIEENEKEKANRLDEECTFQPRRIPRAPIEENVEQQINVQSIDKFLERMNMAKELKEKNEKQWQDKIGSGKHWKDQMTIPEAPKLVGRNKQGKKPKALNKPINIGDSVSLKQDNSVSSFKRHHNYPQTTRAREFEAVESQAKVLMQKKNEKNKELLKIDERMDYEQALWAIHSHILALDV